MPDWPEALRAHDLYEQHVGRLHSTGRLGSGTVLPLGATNLLDAEARRTPVGRMSHGQQRRLNLALRLAERPDLLILDEPTNHLSAPLVDDLTAALLTTRAAVVVAPCVTQGHACRKVDAFERCSAPAGAQGMSSEACTR